MAWQFDLNNPYEDIFEESLLRVVESSRMLELVQRACIDILRDPKANEVAVVRGRPVYIAKVRSGDPAMPTLLIAYQVSEREALIRRVLVCKAAEVGSTNAATASQDQLLQTLGTLLARARAQPTANAPDILMPADETSIPKREIAKAVESARKPDKAGS